MRTIVHNSENFKAIVENDSFRRDATSHIKTIERWPVIEPIYPSLIMKSSLQVMANFHYSLTNLY